MLFCLFSFRVTNVFLAFFVTFSGITLKAREGQCELALPLQGCTFLYVKRFSSGFIQTCPPLVICIF